MARMSVKFEGLISPPVTPTHPNGDLNVDVIGQYVDHLVANGVEGVFVNGTTGETISFSVDERKKSAEVWMREGRRKLKFIVIHIGAGSLRETRELAKHAESLGAHAIASLPPLYFKPTTVEQLVDYLKEVADAAPNTPLFYYHFPGITNVTFSLTEILEKGRKKIPTLVGAKHTSIDMFDLGKAVDGGKNHIMNGYDELFGAALVMGARSAVGASYNFCGSLTHQMFTAFKKNDFSEFLKHKDVLVKVIQTLQKHGWSVPLFKAATDLVSEFPVGPPRSPLRPLEHDVKMALAKDLESLGIKINKDKLKK